MSVLESKTDLPDVDELDDDTPDGDAVEAESAAEESTQEGSDEESSERRRHRAGGLLAHWRALAICLALVASAATASWLYFGQYRTDQLTAAATSDVVDAATKGSVALLSYAPDTVDADLAAAQSNLTGEFLTYYGEFAKQIVAPATKQRDVRTTATVVRAAPAEVNPNDAKVLVFLNQVTVSRDSPDPVQAASSVLVGLVKVDGRWLISSFDPI
ncbi:twin-arginine translocation pathway signal [Mycobacterium hodleri]|uniref:twin-arginine translocation pathway signal n=1 Tax=Mycolicibacterium hodleri TaxID=49897 RepID=UPI0021F3BA7C|nr:twin-arginine translocation pathway signal [Mycolicibacterium hodleri]MCV7136236.1 twin-arginine translocation pathway signal [Mycolicibacterium hodleri]